MAWLKKRRSATSFDVKCQKLFLSMVKGATLSDFMATLIYDKLLAMVRVYDHHSRSCLPVDPASIARPTVWALARYHTKYIWAGKHLPSVDSLNDAVHQFGNRLKWKLQVLENQYHIRSCV